MELQINAHLEKANENMHLCNKQYVIILHCYRCLKYIVVVIETKCFT